MFEELLKQKGMNIAQLSKKSGVGYNYIYKIVKDQTDFERCGIGTAKKIANALNISLDEIFEIKENKCNLKEIEATSRAKVVKSHINQEKDWQLLLTRDMEWDQFRSETSHILKRKGLKNFLDEAISLRIVDNFWQQRKYSNAFYILATIDFLSEMLKKGSPSSYDDIRKRRLETPLVPRSIVLKAKIEKNPSIIMNAIEECKKDECGKFFYRHNIIEKELFDAI